MRLKTLVTLRRTKINACVDFFGRKFDTSHHLVKTCSKILEHKRDEACSVLKNYHHEFQPVSQEEALGLKFSENVFPVFEFPWGTFKETENQTKKNILESRFCGPSSEALIKTELNGLIALLTSIRDYGFNPLRYRSLIGRVDIINGEMSAPIIIQGNHRLACLAAMGYHSVLTTTLDGYRSIVDCSKISTWKNVQLGKCSMQYAEQIALAYCKNIKCS